MELLFVCDKCETRKVVENPVVTKFMCDCGGTFGISVIQPSRRKTDAILKVNPDDEKTTLMDSLLEITKPAEEFSEALYRYKVAMCPKCGWIQTTEAVKSLKCRRCNKISTFHSKGKWNVRVKSFPNQDMACVCAKEWSMKEGKNVKRL